MASYNPAAVQATTSASHPAPLSTMQVSSSTSSPQRGIAITQQHVQMNMQGVNVTVQSHSVAMRAEVSRTSLKGEASVVAASVTGPLKNQALESPTRPALPPAQALPTGAQASGVPTNVGPPPASQHHPIVARTPSNTTQGAVVQQNMNPNVATSQQHAHLLQGQAPKRALELQPQTEAHSGAQVGVPINAATTSRAPLPITDGERGLAPQPPLVPGPYNGSEQTVARLERTGEALGQAKQLKLDHFQVQVGNVQGGVLRAEVLEEQQREVVQQGIEITDSGEVRTRQYIHTERIFYRRVLEIMYIAASNEPEEPELTKKKCIDCCFQAISCNFSPGLKNFLTFGRGNTAPAPEDGNKAPKPLSAVQKIKQMSGVLLRGRAKGWVIHTEMIFPLVRDSFRYAWVIAEFLAMLVSFILSVVTFSLGNNRIFTILHLALTIVGTILAIIDGFITFKDFPCFKCCKHNRDSGSGAPDPSAGRNNCCKECVKYTRSVFDVGRVILAELLFYPILISDIFEMITSETYFFDNAVDGISFVLFGLSLASQLFFVYIVRIAVLIAANCHSQKERVPDKDIRDKCDFDPNISKSARYFQCYFAFHVCAQMVAQILMFIIIAGAIREENKHLFEEVIEDESIHASNKLWYMLVAGYILPICGILTFFIVTYFLGARVSNRCLC